LPIGCFPHGVYREYRSGLKPHKNGYLDMKNRIFLLIFGTLVCTAPMALAGTITVSGAVGGQPVAAQADYIFGAGTLQITLTNLVQDQRSVSQAISGIDFSLTHPPAGPATLTAHGDLISVNRKGAVSGLGSSDTLDWYITSGFYTTALGSSGPDHTILGLPSGDGFYSNANRSIRNNGPHNPFVHHQAVLLYLIPGVTEHSRFAAFTFLFGTNSQRLAGEEKMVENPEPAALLLMGTGLVGLAVLHRRRKAA
jgi:hypothetical protein